MIGLRLRRLVVLVLTHFLLLLGDVELRTPRPLPLPFGEERERLGEALRNRCAAQNHPEFSNRIPGLTKIVLKLFYDQFWHWRLPDCTFQAAMDFLGAEEAFEDQILAIEAEAGVVEATTLAERISCETLNF